MCLGTTAFEPVSVVGFCLYACMLSLKPFWQLMLDCVLMLLQLWSWNQEAQAWYPPSRLGLPLNDGGLGTKLCGEQPT